MKLRDKPLPDPSDIDLIIFDLGGVLLDIDYSLTQSAFAAIGVEDVATLYSKAAQSALFDHIETGKMSPDDFRDGLRKVIGLDVTSEELDLAWNALIQDLPIHRLRAVQEMQKDFRTCILSNTNEIHVPCFERVISDTIGISEYTSAFEEIFYSSRIGLRKPDPKAFEYVLQQMKVKPKRALFIDDSEQHIHAARGLGLHAYHLEVGVEDVSEVLARFTDRLA